MNSRNPKTFGPPQIRAALFRVADSGGLALNVPVDATLSGQLSTISPNRGVRLALGAGAEDQHLEPAPSGGIRIKIT
jgi:hypothetical protein